MRKSAFAIFVVSLSLSAVFLILYATSTYGIGISPDSVGYIAVARNLADGNGFTDYQGNAFVIQPPLFPIALASVELLSGIDPEEGARFLNALVAGCTVGLGGFVLLRFVRGPLVVLGGLAILFSTPQIAVSTYAWSEPLFNLLVLIFLTIIISHSSLGRREVVFLGVVTALACLTRYIGYSLVATGVILILIQGGGGRTKLINSLLFGAISVFPIGMWLIRNWIVSSTLFGPRAPSRYSLFDNLYYTYSTVFTWFLTGRLLSLRLIILAIIVFGILGVAIYAYTHNRHAKIMLTAEMMQPIQIGLFIVVYTAFLVVSSTTTAYDRIGTRLLSPIAVPLILVLVLLLENITSWLAEFPRPSGRAIRTSLIGLFAIWLVGQMGYSLHIVSALVDKGAGGYNSQPWQQSDTIKYLRTHLPQEDTAIYSNWAWIVIFSTGIQARNAPKYHNSEKLADDLSTLEGKWPEYPGSYLIYFDKERSGYFTVDELSSVADISLMTELSDGKIYRVLPKQR